MANCFYYTHTKGYMNGKMIYHDCSRLHYGEPKEQTVLTCTDYEQLRQACKERKMAGVWLDAKYRLRTLTTEDNLWGRKLNPKKAFNYKHIEYDTVVDNVRQWELRELNASEYAEWCRDNIGHICPLQ